MIRTEINRDTEGDAKLSRIQLVGIRPVLRAQTARTEFSDELLADGFPPCPLPHVYQSRHSRNLFVVSRRQAHLI